MTDLVCRTSDGFAAALLSQLPSAVTVTDIDGTIVCWNRLAEELYGYPASEVLGTPLAGLGVGPANRDEKRAIVRSVLTTGAWTGEYDTRRGDGSLVRVSMTVSRITDEDWGFDGFIGVSVDVSARAELSERLAYDTLHDPLTGLPNRRLFIDHVERALARNARSGDLTAVVVVDLDDFRGINERLGHEAGDRVLQSVAEVLTAELRNGDLVARLGGDEFFVCCDDVPSPAEAQQLAERIARALRVPLDLDGRRTAVSASIGVAVAAAATGPEAMMRNAYAAMYTAKSSIHGTVSVFDDAVHEANRLRQDQVRELRAALEAGDVETYFQPQVALVTGKLVGFEALARWNHADRGPIAPTEFIAVAERGGLIGQLGLLVLRDACAAAKRWNRVSDAEVQVAVNVSAHQLADPTFPDAVRGIIASAGIPAHLVCLELTESALIDIEVASVAFAELKAIGVDLALDDFGTGFSSLSRLHRFPLDWVKLDRGFVQGMMSRTEDAIIVSSVVSLARALGLRTVGEGVEDVRQLERLTATGCDVGQGYLWSPAVPADASLWMVEASLGSRSPEETAERLIERPEGRVPGRGSHRVQLYEGDDALIATVSDAFSAAAEAGHAVLLVATPPHRQAIGLELERRGVLLPPGSFHAVDAGLTLGSLLVGGEPDAAKFDAVVGSLVRELATAWPGVAIYGEMVGILWDRGQALAALQLEDLWNRLAGEVDFSLLCGYHLAPGADPSDFMDVCAVHSEVLFDDRPVEAPIRAPLPVSYES